MKTKYADVITKGAVSVNEKNAVIKKVVLQRAVDEGGDSITIIFNNSACLLPTQVFKQLLETELKFDEIDND